MNRYPHLPTSLHTLLEAGSWEGTPTELYTALEPYRVEPWPANPVSLSLWLKHHARGYGITVTPRHTGERRLLRLAREANGLEDYRVTKDNVPFWRFATWSEVYEGLAGALEGVSGEVTLASDLGQSRVSQAIPITWLHLVVERWAAQFPQAHEIRIYRGEVEVATVWPL